MLMFEGEIGQAIATNPLVVVAVPVLLVGPVVLLLFSDRCFQLWNLCEQTLTEKRGLVGLGIVIGSVWLYLIIRALLHRF